MQAAICRRDDATLDKGEVMKWVFTEDTEVQEL